MGAGRARRGPAAAGDGPARGRRLTKVFPLAAAPVALAWLAGRRAAPVRDPAAFEHVSHSRERPTPAALALVAVLAAGAALAVALSPSGAVDVLRYHFDRPPQVESTPAVALLVLDALGAHTTTVVSSFGSQGVPGSGASGLAAAFAAAGVAAVALLAARAYARPEPRELVLGSLAAVAAFAAFGKVLSPQFAAWIVPLLALALAWRDWALAAVTACAMTLTLFEFPFRYWDLVAGRSGAVALVAARDVAMLGAVALCAIAMRPGSARALRPSAAPPPAPARSA